MKKAYQLTPAGRDDLQNELDELKSRRGEIAQKIADARDFGDLSENAEWDAARDEQAQVETRIAEIEDILMNAKIIKSKGGTTIGVGSRVVLQNDKGKTVEYSIVGSVEADPLEGRISDESPIGQALLGKKSGESVTINTPGGEITYKITEIK
jgi:transcription elongation factor GreA